MTTQGVFEAGNKLDATVSTESEMEVVLFHLFLSVVVKYATLTAVRFLTSVISVAAVKRLLPTEVIKPTPYLT